MNLEHTDLPRLACMLAEDCLFLPSMCWDYRLVTTPTQHFHGFRVSDLWSAHVANTLPNEPYSPGHHRVTLSVVNNCPAQTRHMV